MSATRVKYKKMKEEHKLFFKIYTMTTFIYELLFCIRQTHPNEKNI